MSLSVCLLTDLAKGKYSSGTVVPKQICSRCGPCLNISHSVALHLLGINLLKVSILSYRAAMNKKKKVFHNLKQNSEMLIASVNLESSVNLE